MENTNNFFEHFEFQYTPSSVLNALFSANYTLLRILNEQKPLDAPQQMVFTADDIFGSGKKEKLYDYWLDGKVEAYAELRRNLFAESKQHIPSKQDADKLFIINSSRFMAAFNKAYGTKKTISDVFDRRYILDSQFATDYAYKNNQEIARSPELVELFGLYDEFLGFLTDYYCVEAARDIYNALEDDLNYNGYRSNRYNKPENPNVMKLDWNTFVEISHFVADIYDNSYKTLQDIKKLMDSLDKKLQRDPENPDYKQQVNDLVQAFSPVYTEVFISEHLLEYLDEVETRFNSANKTYEGFSTKIRDKVFNFMSNQTFSSNNPELEIDTVYMHRHELSDIIDMLHGLAGSDELYKQLIKKYPLCERKSVDLFAQKGENE